MKLALWFMYAWLVFITVFTIRTSTAMNENFTVIYNIFRNVDKAIKDINDSLKIINKNFEIIREYTFSK